MDQVRLLQGDHLPRRGGARRARLPQVPLPVPHLRARAHRAARWTTGSFEEREAGLHSARSARLQGHQEVPRPREDRPQKTGLEEAVVTGLARIGGLPGRAVRVRVRLPRRQHGLGGGREADARDRAGDRQARARCSSCPPRAARACRRASSRSCRWPRPRPRSSAWPGAAALSLAAHRSDHGRRDGELRHAGRRHPGRAARAHRLRRARA